MSLIGSWDASPWWGLVGLRGEAAPLLWRLARDATRRVEARRGPVELRCEAGTLVVTRAGDPEDHVLEAGDRLRVARRDRAVVWALSDAAASAVPLSR